MAAAYSALNEHPGSEPPELDRADVIAARDGISHAEDDHSPDHPAPARFVELIDPHDPCHVGSGPTERDWHQTVST